MDLLELHKNLSALQKAGARIALVGIGSELHGDDQAGILVARGVAQQGLANLRCIEAASAPENVTGELIRFAPRLTIFVDAVNLGEPPGTIRIIDSEEISMDNFSTHALPLPVISAYLKAQMETGVLVIGIQPESVELGAELTPAVLEAASRLIEVFSRGSADNLQPKTEP